MQCFLFTFSLLSKTTAGFHIKYSVKYNRNMSHSMKNTMDVDIHQIGYKADIKFYKISFNRKTHSNERNSLFTSHIRITVTLNLITPFRFAIVN